MAPGPAGSAAAVRAGPADRGAGVPIEVRATRRAALAALPALLLAACSGGGGGAQATPALFHRAAAAYLLGLDQLHIAGFTITEAPHSLGPQALSSGDSQLALALRAAGMQEAATVRYFRQPDDLATANGFLDVRSSVLRFGGESGAHLGFLAEERHTDQSRGEVPESTDVLGDEAHADQLTLDSPEGVRLIEVTVIMRNANLVEILVVRGRYGATGLSDALLLAHEQLAGQR